MVPERTDENVTKILQEVHQGVDGAAERLLPIVYEELRGIAGRIFKAKNANEVSIQPTIIVHDVFMKLSQNTDISWKNRSHFYAVAAKATRDLLVDHARRKMAAKRGGGWKRITMVQAEQESASESQIDILDLEEALQQLGAVSTRQERIIEMRFYAGLTTPEIAGVLGVSERTIMHDWRMARAWLRVRLEEG